MGKRRSRLSFASGRRRCHRLGLRPCRGLGACADLFAYRRFLLSTGEERAQNNCGKRRGANRVKTGSQLRSQSSPRDNIFVGHKRKSRKYYRDPGNLSIAGRTNGSKRPIVRSFCSEADTGVSPFIDAEARSPTAVLFLFGDLSRAESFHFWFTHNSSTCSDPDLIQ